MKTIKNILAVAVLLFIGFVFFYSSSSVKLAKEIESSYTYSNQNITLEGTFDAPFITRTGSTISMEFTVCNDFLIIQTGNRKLNRLKMNYGEGKNSVLIDVPEGSRKFEQKDVVIFDKDGNKLKTTDKVRITGQLIYPGKDVKNTSTVKNYSTGKLTTTDEGNDYSYEIINIVVEKI